MDRLGCISEINEIDRRRTDFYDTIAEVGWHINAAPRVTFKSELTVANKNDKACLNVV